MATDIDMASNALILIGDNPISAFTESGAGATAASNLYSTTYRSFLSFHPWTFALKEVYLSRLTATPDPETNFTYAFQVPADHIRTWAIFPKSNFTQVGQLIYSDEPSLLMRYVYQCDETDLPPHCVVAMEYLLASKFAQHVTESTSKSETFYAMYKEAISTALSVDSQNRPQQPIIDSPFTDIR